MGGFPVAFVPLLIKSCWVISKGVLGRQRFVGPSLLAPGVEGPILLLAQRITLSVLALPMGASSRHPSGNAAAGPEELKAVPAVWQRLTKSSFVCDERIGLARGR